MMRAIIKQHRKDPTSGAETQAFRTVDFDVPELEELLTGGGFGEDGYDTRALIGLEFLPKGDHYDE